jgi:hypothetical protein
MKWGQIPSSNDPSALLILAIMFAIEDPYHSMTKNISDMFEIGGEIGGDPGWEIHHRLNDDGNEIFDVWVDPRVSGIGKLSRSYNANLVRRTAREVLDGFAENNPEKCREVEQLLVACNL